MVRVCVVGGWVIGRGGEGVDSPHKKPEKKHCIIPIATITNYIASNHYICKSTAIPNYHDYILVSWTRCFCIHHERLVCELDNIKLL